MGNGKHKVGNGGLYLEVALASARCRRRAVIIRALKALVAPFDVDNLQKGVINMNATSELLRRKKGQNALAAGHSTRKCDKCAVHKQSGVISAKCAIKVPRQFFWPKKN